MSYQTELKTQKLTRAVDILAMHGGFTGESFKKADTALHDAGLHLTVADQMALINLQGTTKFSAPEGTTVVGPTRSWISNQIVRANMPVADMSNHPLISMFPVIQVNGTAMQQNQYSAGFGMIQPAAPAGGAQQNVPMLKRNGKLWVGYDYYAESKLNGTEAFNMRAMFSDKLNENGAMELCNYQLLNLYDMTVNGIVGRTFDAVKKGSYKAMAKGDGTYIYTSIQKTNEFLFLSDASLGGYNKTTNVFTNNATYPGNVTSEITAILNYIKAAGYETEGMLMDNFIYTAIMQSPSALEKMVYSSAYSGNDIAGIQRNLFKMTAIPTLQGVPLLVYDQGYKFAEGKTNPSTTRPLYWGEDVTAASFRIFFKIRNPNGSPIGNTAFFSNLWRDGMFSSVNSGTSIDLRMIDTTQYQPTNPAVQLFATTTVAITYNDEAAPLVMFDPQIVVTE